MSDNGEPMRTPPIRKDEPDMRISDIRIPEPLLSNDKRVENALNQGDSLRTPPIRIPLPILESLFNLAYSTGTYTEGKCGSLELEEVRIGAIRMALGQHGYQTISHLKKYGAITILEVWKNTGASRVKIRHHVDNLLRFGFIKQVATLENEPRIPAQFRNTQVWGLSWLPRDEASEASRQAIERCLRFYVKDKPQPSEVEDRVLEYVKKQPPYLRQGAEDIGKLIHDRFGGEVPPPERSPMAKRILDRIRGGGSA